MKRCLNCLRKEKVFLVDVYLYKGRGGRIRLKQCKKRIGKYCIVLLLDKIVIKLDHNELKKN